MYILRKTITVSGSHHLVLDYESPCQEDHGHNWKITVEARGRAVNKNGMVTDFKDIKRLVSDLLDHKNLNHVLIREGFNGNPTAENLSRFLFERLYAAGVPVYEVAIEETEGSLAIYREDSVI